MVYDYVVTLKNRNARLVDNISILLCVLSLLVFINTLISSGMNMLVMVLCILMVLILLWNFYTGSRRFRSKVVYHFGKPYDMEKAERIVLKGKMEGEVFEITTKDGILIKCPSKYKDDPKAGANNLSKN